MTDDGSRQIESYLSIGSYIFNTRAFEFLNRQSIFEKKKIKKIKTFLRGGWARRSQAQLRRVRHHVIENLI